MTRPSDLSNAAAGMQPDVINRVATLLRQARSVLFITGAGISADSGLPTYRGIGGLYNRELTEEGIPIEEALSGHMLRARPELTWKYIGQIESACRGARYNLAHDIIARLEKRLPRVWVLTQNVDGFHRDAGSQNVIEIHGNTRHLNCTQCSWHQTVADYAELTLPPQCSRCGALVRPKVVLFGEMLPGAALTELNVQVGQGFDLVFSIGTTSAFPYIAQPVLLASVRGAATVEINPGDSEVSHVVDYRIRAGAKDACEAIWQAFLEQDDV